MLVITVWGSAVSQHALTGEVSDCTTGEGIPYATVYHPSSGRGTTPDSTGEFVLSVEDSWSAGDSLLVSSVGYAAGAFAYDERDAERLEVCLTAQQINLPGVTNTAKRFGKARTYGNRSESRQIVTGWSVTPRNGAERGSRIRLRGKEVHMLKTIRLHIASSTYDSLRLRFNLYPGPVPTPSARPAYSWLVDTEQLSGWMNVDVLAEEILLVGDIFLAVEVVEAWSDRTGNQLFLSAGLFTDGLFHRDRHFGEWRRAELGLAINVLTLRD
ncbi:MAG: carboxypeptidase-like regulatory domain-containing protein [Lewinella sp.]